MKKLLLGVAAAILHTSIVYAGEVAVVWQHPENFSDIRPSIERIGDFRERVMKELGDTFSDLAKKLPEGYHWSVTVSDVDLAGEMKPLRRRNGDEVRVMENIYPPRISLTYTLKDPQGKIVSEGEEQLIDIAYLQKIKRDDSSGTFYYEQRMLQDWFAKKQKDKVFP